MLLDGYIFCPCLKPDFPMKDPNSNSEDLPSPDQENKNPLPEVSQQPDPALQEEEPLNSPKKTEFEGQEGEVLPPEERKKSGSGKAILFLILILGASGGYLYFNNLIPAEILNAIFPRPIPSKPSASVAQIPPAPLPIEDEATDLFSTILVPSIAETEPQGTALQESTHLSKNSTGTIPETQISDNNFSHAPKVGPEEELEENLQKEAEQAMEHEQGVSKAQKVAQEPVSEVVALSIEEAEPSESSPPLAERNEATRAYLDFIELSFQKLGELIKEGFNFGWDFIQKKLG